MEMSQDQKVAQYYDRNTARFIKHGHGGPQLAIHRAVWAPGVQNRRQAMEWVSARVVQSLEAIRGTSSSPQSIRPLRYLDLGCGVGGTLAYAAQSMDKLSLSGLTISGVQSTMAAEIFSKLGINGRCAVGDFHQLSDVSRFGPQDAISNIESLVHAQEPAKVIAAVAQNLKPGGRWLLCDDFLSDDSDLVGTSVNQALIGRFQRGWHAPHLMTLDALREEARNHGLEPMASENLNQYLELGRGRDRLIKLILPLCRPWAKKYGWFQNMEGGDALQTLLNEQIIKYYFVEFVKT